uniref:Uncharacterized protein n=1 Tax=Arundo donax TaxID=35708 RepID=A0A0A9FYM7_ARUDO
MVVICLFSCAKKGRETYIECW